MAMTKTIGQLKPSLTAMARPMRIWRHLATALAATEAVIDSLDSGTREVGWVDSVTTVSVEGTVVTDAMRRGILEKCQCAHLYLLYCIGQPAKLRGRPGKEQAKVP